MIRRNVLIGLGIAPVAACARTSSANGDDATDEPAEYLFVQSARSATLKDGVLTLKGVAPTTIFFTDRPERIAGHVETEHLIEALLEDKEANSFAEDPPNGVLSILDGEYAEEVVMTLMDPTIEGDEISYPVKVLDGATELEGGPASLFIDPIGRPLSPGSVAGVHRRHERRRRRRIVRH